MPTWIPVTQHYSCYIRRMWHKIYIFSKKFTHRQSRWAIALLYWRNQSSAYLFSWFSCHTFSSTQHRISMVKCWLTICSWRMNLFTWFHKCWKINQYAFTLEQICLMLFRHRNNNKLLCFRVIHINPCFITCDDLHLEPQGLQSGSWKSEETTTGFFLSLSVSRWSINFA